VGYPILDLRGLGLDVHRYIWKLEWSLLSLLQNEYGLPVRLVKGFIGVWCGDEKIAAIGVNVKSGVTKHGFALNVNPDMGYFRMINPCGIRNKGVTSITRLTGKDIPVSEVFEKYLKYFGETFNLKTVEIGLEDLRRMLHGEN
jgi:lipoyl(octanoyl) transferase